MGVALGTGELFHQGIPTLLPWQSCFCLSQLWADPVGRARWGAAGNAPTLACPSCSSLLSYLFSRNYLPCRHHPCVPGVAQAQLYP